MPEAAIDQTILSELSDSMGEDFMQELVSTYLADTPEQIRLLLEAYDRRDADAFRRSAHTIKSTSLNFGAKLLSGQARELEEVGRAGNLDGSEPRLMELQTLFEQVRHELKELGYA